MVIFWTKCFFWRFKKGVFERILYLSKILSPNGENSPQIKTLVWYGIFEIPHGYWQ